MNKKESISAAVEMIDFTVRFEAQRGNDGKLEKYAQFDGATSFGRELEYTEFYANLAELPDKLRERYADFDVEEEVKIYLDAKGNGLRGVPDLFELIDDVKESEALILRLAEAVEAGLKGKLPEPPKTRLDIESEYDVQLKKALGDPANPLTGEALSALDRVVETACGHGIRWLIRHADLD